MPITQDRLGRMIDAATSFHAQLIELLNHIARQSELVAQGRKSYEDAFEWVASLALHTSPDPDLTRDLGAEQQHFKLTRNKNFRAAERMRRKRGSSSRAASSSTAARPTATSPDDDDNGLPRYVPPKAEPTEVWHLEDEPEPDFASLGIEPPKRAPTMAEIQVMMDEARAEREALAELQPPEAKAYRLPRDPNAPERTYGPARMRDLIAEDAEHIAALERAQQPGAQPGHDSTDEDSSPIDGPDPVQPLETPNKTP